MNSCLIPLLLILIATNHSEETNDSRITATVETQAVNGDVDEDAADDAAFWYNRESPMKSIVLGTDKKFGINLYDLNGRRLKSYKAGCINNIDVRQGVFGSVDLVGASNRDTVAMDFWRLKGEPSSLVKVGSIPTRLPDIYGFCLGTNVSTNEVYAFANSKTGRVEQWLLAFSDGEIQGKLVREMQLPSQVEGMVADDKLSRLYVGVEEAGIYRFEIDAKASNDGQLVADSTEANSHIKYDIEGLTIFSQDDGNGYLIASCQGNNTFAVFSRTGNNKYVASFEISAGKCDGVQETDGIQAVNLPLGSKFPKGIFICQDGINVDGERKMAQNFKYVSWDMIARNLNLK